MTAAFVVLCCLLAAALTWASLQLRRGLQRQRRLAGTLTAHLDEGVCLLDHHGRLTFLSPAAERMLDCRAAEMRGKRLRDVLPLPELTQDGGLDAAISRGAPLILEEVRVSRGDGSQLPVSLSIVPIMAGGNVDEMVVTLNDRTDRARAAIHRSGEEYYRTLLEVSPDGIVVADPYGYILMANARAAEMHGYDTPDDLCGMRLQSLVTPELQRPMTEQRQKTINECAARSGEYTSLRKDGATLPTEISTSPVLGDGNQLTALLVVVRDLSARKRAETLLRESAGRESLQQIAADVLAQSASVSEAVPKLLEAIGEAGGWDLGLFWGRDERERVLRCGDAWQGTSAHLSPFVAESREASVSHGSDLLGDVWAKEEPLWTSDGTLPYLRLRVAADAGLRTAVCFPITGEGTFHGVMEFYSRTARPADQPFMQTMSAVGGMLAQFLKRRYAEKQLEYQALHDALTDLPNRTLLGIRLERALSVAAGRNARLAVLLMDLDRFKEVNDTFGHQMGDTLLVEVARRLSGVMRESDTVARLGGDEFALLLPNTAEADAVAVAGRIAAAIEQPFHIEDQHLDVGISIGIALYPIHGPDGATLMQHADVAMYQAKRERTTHALYRPHEDENTPTRFGLGAELRLALDQHQVLLHYQPKIGLATGRVDAVEALVRWNHPDLGLVPPGDFMPMAERSGLIQPLTAWIIDEAARQHHSWRDLGHDLRVAVNLSAQSLHDAGLVGMVREILEAREIAPDRLVLEITEAAVLVNAERALATVTELHAMGVRISVDDFGKGRSSLVNLRRLPADELKIDQSFVIDMAAGQQDDVIVRVMIDLAHGLGLAAVAEGVQDEKTYKLLVEMECDQAQGFHIGRPMPGWELGLWLDQHVAAPRPSLRPPLQFRPRAQAGA